MDNHQVDASSESEAFQRIREWAASLGLAESDNVVLAIKRPDGTLKTFERKDF